jgi:uncharacterized protein YjeT (DUF2065 family)
MSIIHSIQFFVALNLFVIGLSHFLQPKIWIDFFQYLSKKGHIGNIFNGLLSLTMGTIILSFHFVWTWPMILITLYGLAQFLKGVIYLTIPSIGLKSIGKVDTNFKKFRWVGLVMCSLSILIAYSLVNNWIYKG